LTQSGKNPLTLLLHTVFYFTTNQGHRQRSYIEKHQFSLAAESPKLERYFAKSQQSVEDPVFDLRRRPKSSTFDLGCSIYLSANINDYSNLRQDTVHLQATLVDRGASGCWTTSSGSWPTRWPWTDRSVSRFGQMRRDDQTGQKGPRPGWIRTDMVHARSTLLVAKHDPQTFFVSLD